MTQKSRFSLLFLLIIFISYLIVFFTIPKLHAGGSFFKGIPVVSRSTWWDMEYKSTCDYQMQKKYVKRGRRQRLVVCSTKVPAPSHDIKGYVNRTWCHGCATVKGYDSIVWHHTQSTDQAPNLVEMALFHRRKDFMDTAYHFIIKRNASNIWTIYEGTPLGYIGSHAHHFNINQDKAIGSLGIVVAGNFDVQIVDEDLKKIMAQLQDYHHSLIE
jgi:hypothetical protein